MPPLLLVTIIVGRLPAGLARAAWPPIAPTAHAKGTRPFAVAESSGFALVGRHDREETQAREPVLVLSAARAPRAAAGAALAVRAPARHQCRHRACRGARLAIRRHARLSLPRRVELAPVVRPRRHDPWRHGSLPGARRRRQQAVRGHLRHLLRAAADRRHWPDPVASVPPGDASAAPS